MSRNAIADESGKKSGAKIRAKVFKALTAPIQITPVFESVSANILEIGETGYEGKSIGLCASSLLAELPKDATIPSLVRVEFNLRQQGLISIYARWTRQGRLFDFDFIVITPEDQAIVGRFLDSTG